MLTGPEAIDLVSSFTELAREVSETGEHDWSMIVRLRGGCDVYHGWGTKVANGEC